MSGIAISMLPFLGAKNPSKAKQGMADASTRCHKSIRRSRTMDDSSKRILSPRAPTRTRASRAASGPAFGRSKTGAIPTTKTSRRSKGDDMGESERVSSSRRGDRMGQSERVSSSRRRESRESPEPKLTRTKTLGTGTHRK